MSRGDAGLEPVRRFEVFTGAGRRRDWSDEAKAATVAESQAGLEGVCAAARRHGLSHSRLFTGRRRLRRPSAATGKGLTPWSAPVADQCFVPVVVEAPVAAARKPPRTRRARIPGQAAPAVELAIEGVSVRIAKGADPRTITAATAAPKRGS